MLRTHLPPKHPTYSHEISSDGWLTLACANRSAGAPLASIATPTIRHRRQATAPAKFVAESARCEIPGDPTLGCGREGLLLRRGLSTQPGLFHGGDGRESALGARWSRAGCAQAAASACASCIKVLAPQMLAGWGRCVVEARGRQSCHSIVQAQQHKSWQLCPISFLADLTARS